MQFNQILISHPFVCIECASTLLHKIFVFGFISKRRKRQTRVFWQQDFVEPPFSTSSICCNCILGLLWREEKDNREFRCQQDIVNHPFPTTIFCKLHAICFRHQSLQFSLEYFNDFTSEPINWMCTLSLRFDKSVWMYVKIQVVLLILQVFNLF